MDDTTAFHGLVEALSANARDLAADLGWLQRVLDARLKAYFRMPESDEDPLDIPPPALADSASPYGSFMRAHCIPPRERLVLLLALAPHVCPQLLDVLWSRNDVTQRGFTEFGGAQSASHGGFLPTGETAAFLLAGDDLAARFETARLFEADALLARHGVVQLAAAAAGEPALSGMLVVSPRHLQRCTTGAEARPSFGDEFPAQPIRTGLQWEDLVLPAATLEQIEETRRWMLHGGQLLDDWGMRDRLRPNYTSLFYGPSGTGKSLTACLLGKYCGGREVWRLDVSKVVSRYVGEASKALSRVFDAAESKGWILYFDEADALFGTRTRTRDAQDHYVNQDIGFLLQRIEEFDGVCILSSNQRLNIDAAFMRRFHSVVHFPMPKPPERLRLWRNAFPRKARLEANVDLAAIAQRHELSGGAIMNVVRHASLMALSRGGDAILLEDVEEGIRRELVKDGRGF
jgi:hypothetical protein